MIYYTTSVYKPRVPPLERYVSDSVQVSVNHIMKKKKTTTQKKKNKLDKECIALWKLACDKMWGNSCIMCGKTDQTTFHHYIPRSRSTLLKYDPINGVPICNMRAHYKLHHNGTPDEVREICDTIRRKRGKVWCKYIDEKKQMRQSSFYTIGWLEEQKQKLKEYLNE